ncbi:MAG: SDR family oxidoreductase [Bacteroidetes bacterium]|nr:SDR family oxidoreductase [Bacteroidota bacterium]
MSNYVVAGGSSGIGKSLTEKLLYKGCKVYVLARSRRDLPEHPNLEFISVDFTQDGINIQSLPDTIDGLVYSPGTIHLSPFNRIKRSQFEQDFKINVLGAVELIQQALPALKKSGKSSVVLFSTVAVQTGMNFHSSIAASKGAIEGLTRSLAAEYALAGIRFNCIAPSLTNTPLAEKLVNTPEKLAASNTRHPIGRIGTPEDVSSLADFLLSEESSWMTGQILGLDGGMGSIKML